MKTPLWTPSEQRKQDANITRFMREVSARHKLNLDSYSDLYQWSVENIPDFWVQMWDFVEIKASKHYDSVVMDVSVFPGAKWFPGAKLNFAENLLRYRDDHLAFVFIGETQTSKRMTYAELYDAVARLAHSLKESGVGVGDRVVAYMPNLIETVIAMLAAASLGATWASCATDIGPGAAIERLGQVGPKVMITADGYFYKGKAFDTLAHAAEVTRGIPSLQKVIVVSYTREQPDISQIPNSVHYDDFLAKEKNLEIQFEQLPFDHPHYIMFSSGTTGKPKCLVQSAGGVLINHLKELILHTDLKRSDKIFYITSCSWMMWNWLVSSLSVGATIILYDGNPNFPDSGAMWKLIQDERIAIFGCSASYIHFLKKENVSPRTSFDLSSLREISQTGSPLSADGFEYVYKEIKADLHFNSIAGGTDINGCFAAGSPIVSVYAGELQSAALGMKIKSYDENGHPILDEQGELVCEAPSPSMPLYFWNDPDGSKYHKAYFDVYPNVWRHGDYILIHKDTGGVTFYGRSDAVLKPSGVRIGTAEIYAQMENLPEVMDSLAVGQNYQEDQRVILFVKLAAGYVLSDELKDKIKKTLRENASPRHVPAVILEAPEIPYTLNMKKVESAVTNILNGRAVSNRDALINPRSLEFYEKVLEKLT
ncbi:MAG TPA: acetoacetate--CoA ligase [Anaerolineales bacterium]|jgi:acetoacetyl-CoA synthetase|nr:acetoacetate--CoA ligase [Anaerolineales bacterium]HQX16223.1 acetoacetate--CoA ligase [Anaerolineales bacterium]